MEYYDEALIVPLIIAMTEFAKRYGLPKRYAALFAWALGLGMAYFYIAPGDFKKTFFFGSALGMSAAGLFSGAKSTLKGK